MSQDSNPYTPPASNLNAVATSDAIELASKGRRFWTLVIDYICFFLFSFLMGMVLAIVGRLTGVDVIKAMPEILFGTVLMLTYYFFFEGIWARTPGKLICGTVVIDEAGGKPSFAHVLKRSLCRFIPFEAFSFLGERGWHDSISKTYVVLKK